MKQDLVGITDDKFQRWKIVKANLILSGNGKCIVREIASVPKLEGPMYKLRPPTSIDHAVGIDQLG